MRLKQLARSWVLTGFSVPAALQRATRLPILTYHAVTDDRAPISIPPALLRRQVEVLQDLGYRTVTFAEAVRMLREGRLPRERVVCMTFDDAYCNMAEHALPLLRDAGFTATIFAPTEYLGKPNRWYPASHGWPVLGWDDLRAIGEEGFEVASHSRTHPRLRQLDDASVRQELEGSKRELEDRLGKAVTTFCYPYGDYDDRIAAATRAAGYDGACTTEYGACRPGTDPFRIPRVGTAPLLTPYQFRAALGGAVELYMRARGLAAPLPADVAR